MCESDSCIFQFFFFLDKVGILTKKIANTKKGIKTYKGHRQTNPFTLNDIETTLKTGQIPITTRRKCPQNLKSQETNQIGLKISLENPQAI